MPSDDILTREIQLPDLNALPLDASSLTAPLLEIIAQQARVISSETVKINALVATCREQAEQIAALKARVMELERRPAGVVDGLMEIQDGWSDSRLHNVSSKAAV